MARSFDVDSLGGDALRELIARSPRLQTACRRDSAIIDQCGLGHDVLDVISVTQVSEFTPRAVSRWVALREVLLPVATW